MFWPTAHFSNPENRRASFGGFCACTLVIACGLATPETAANSYAVVIGNPATASARLQFCQSWNGVASYVKWSDDSRQPNPAVDQFDDEIGAWLLYKQRNMIFAFIAQFCYFGAQVTIAAFIDFIRFVATGIATVLQLDFIMMVYTVITIGFNAFICVGRETPSVGVLIAILFFEAPITLGVAPASSSWASAEVMATTSAGLGALEDDSVKKRETVMVKKL
ncbi:putative L-fucose:H+ symporter permease-like protein [Seiridium cardinale]|uniref:L-fucose:H+ symporter permease-like protein n=1 Tax=Seiridium cardinale TaxID=138064 RepID=A0ABR2XFK5_9PEZI